MIDPHILELLNLLYRQSVVIVPRHISPEDARRLLELGYIQRVWVNTYALTSAGDRARRTASDDT